MALVYEYVVEEVIADDEFYNIFLWEKVATTSPNSCLVRFLKH